MSIEVSVEQIMQAAHFGQKDGNFVVKFIMEGKSYQEQLLRRAPQ